MGVIMIESTEKKLQKAQLENWSIRDECGDYFCKDSKTLHLRGMVFGHPRFENGTPIRSSLIQTIDVKNCRATTMNTEYELLSISPTFDEYVVEKGINLEEL